MDCIATLKEFVQCDYTVIQCPAALFGGVSSDTKCIYVDDDIATEISQWKELVENINKRLSSAGRIRYSIIPQQVLCIACIASYSYSINEASLVGVTNESIERVWKFIEVSAVTLHYRTKLSTYIRGRSAKGFVSSVWDPNATAIRMVSLRPFVSRITKGRMTELSQVEHEQGAFSFKSAMTRDLVSLCNLSSDPVDTLTSTLLAYSTEER